MKCKIIVEDESYQMFLPPLPLGDDAKSTIDMEADLISIDNI